MGVCSSKSNADEVPISVTKTTFMITDDVGEPTKVVKSFSPSVRASKDQTQRTQSMLAPLVPPAAQ